MKTILLSIVLLSGCRSTVDRIAYVTDGKTPEGMIVAACHMWEAIGVRCEPTAVAEATVSISGYSNAETHDEGEADIYGKGVPIPITVNLAKDGMAVTMAHEFGHCLGLDHLDSGPAVMNTRAGYRGDVLTSIDINGFFAIFPDRSVGSASTQ